MELWEACFFVLILDLTFGKDFSSNATYVVRKIDSCPEVGYFFKREPSPNLLDAAPCYLCFCKDSGTATCWERERRRCDVEKYHHHRVGRQSRYRRSFSDVFFRDATRDFFGKNLPEQCKPFESSFSDGCPPADWCIGCTICDCDSNGQWDCHILSFCDGKESKKKIKSLKHRKNKKDKKSFDYESLDVRPNKKAPTRKSSKKATTKPKTTKTPKKNYRKVLNSKTGNKTNTRTNKAPKKSSIKQQISNKITRKTQSKAMSQNHSRNNVSRVKIIKTVMATRKPVTLNGNSVKGIELNANNSDTLKLGQKIVKQVMTTFKKILAKELLKLNETQKSKLIDGKNCGEVKTRNKRTYNVRSKAAARNKNKYNRPGMVKENYTNARIKRETLQREQASLEKVSVITLPDVNAVIPLDTIKEKNSSSSITKNVTTLPLFTTQQDSYYEYSIKNDSFSTSTTELAKNVSDNRESKITNILVISAEFYNDTSVTTKKTDTKATSADFNDLKLSKWYITKIKNDERKKAVTRLILPKPSTTNTFEYGNKTKKKYFVSGLQKNTPEPRHNVTKKQNLTSFISKIHIKSCCTKHPNTINKTEMTGLENILQNLFIVPNKTSTSKQKTKIKVGVMKYVRKFFRKIFSKKKTGSHKVYGLGTKEDHTLQILCENIGLCKIKRNNRLILKYKLKQLNKETKNVLISIRTVKGLLHLLELPNSDKTSYVAKHSSFQNDIRKLSIVLKEYKDAEMNSSLTFTQKTQIDYIKKNTQIFIKSVKKFGDLLSDILALIKPNMEYEQSLKSPQKQESHRTILNKIKKMLAQYNIMQNTFMKRMYQLINGEEKRIAIPERTQTLNGNGSDIKIEKYSKNIIESVRKLKIIAQVLSSTRKKRESMMRDDALDYLLTLMEMLIMRNHPLDVPANDGIDLLIDAIKNAPNIKPIKSSSLSNKSINYAPMSIYKLNNTYTSDHLISDSNSDSKRISNEENVTDFEENVISQNIILTDVSSKPETETTQTIDDDDVTQKVYYRVFNQQSNNEDDATTEYNSITKKRSNEEVEKIGFDKFESVFNDPKKLEVEPAYTEDDAMTDIITDNTVLTVNKTGVPKSTVEDQTIFKIKVPVRTTAYNAHSNESSSESQDFMNDKRSKLEWIEQTFDREIKLINNASNFIFKQTTTQPPPTSTKNNMENNSELTKEEKGRVEDIVRRTTKNTKSNNHDVLYTKQIQFLNSLDYGTEKSTDFEETDSKDDRSDDVFPSYFV